jgi:cell cycle arrest protein BUB3
VWDHTSKKRLKQLPKFSAGVAALAFSADGARLAIGAGYGWDAGEEGAATAGPPSLHVFQLGDDVKVCLGVPRLWAALMRVLQPKGWNGA